jgi:hypothetical protein
MRDRQIAAIRPEVSGLPAAIEGIGKEEDGIERRETEVQTIVGRRNG